jgi:tetratricopeptide (TPR) repeat protein
VVILLWVGVARGLAFDQSALARRQYPEAQARYQKEPQSVEAAWQFGRACFDVGEVATNSTERAAVAEQGMAACRQAIAQDPKSVQGHYYLGLNLGQLARTKTLGALKLVGQMEREWSSARALDEKFDYAGADRNLGQLYRDAPSFGSVGSRSKARQHLQRAIELAPSYPENRLELIEALVKWKDAAGARSELKALEKVWPEARSSLTGPAWEGSWEIWETRLKEFRKKLG